MRKILHSMAISDYFGFSFVFGWGLWWIIFPNSVVALDTWLKKRSNRKVYSPAQVRMGGVIWMVLMTGVLISFLLGWH